MNKYIDANKLKSKIRKHLIPTVQDRDYDEWEHGRDSGFVQVISIIDSLQREQPVPYFYCKYGGTMPLCSDCKRNHNNSSFKTEEITTWYAPSNGTKHCIDYIQQEQPKLSGYDKGLLEVKQLVDKLYNEASIGLNEYDSGLYNGIVETCMKLRGFIKARLSSDEQSEVKLDEEEHVGVTESPLKTFQRVNEFEAGGATYRH